MGTENSILPIITGADVGPCCLRIESLVILVCVLYFLREVSGEFSPASEWSKRLEENGKEWK